MRLRFAALTLIGILSTTVAQGASPFAIRGIKGLWWEGIEKYQAALPWVAEHHLNFLMICYTSFPASGKDWRAEYSAKELGEIGALAGDAEKRHVELCVSFNPGIWSKPPLMYSSESDYAIAWNKVKTLHATGVHSFSLCLDDINTALQPADAERFKNLQNCQVYFANRLWKDMQTLSPKPRFIFCPSAYTTGEMEKHLEYTKTIGAEMDSGIEMFWTGPTVCSASITKADADKVAGYLRRKPIVWDNYPVNDMFPWRPLLAPVKNRSTDLADGVAGLMANPMKQWNISRIPLATLAEYLNDPAGYDPARAKEDSINEWPVESQTVVREIVEIYGTTFLGEKNYPPEPVAGKTADETTPVLARCVRLWTDLEKTPALADVAEEIRPTLKGDITKLEGVMKGAGK